jgi:hydrogenase nickel incorporation protein HypB
MDSIMKVNERMAESNRQTFAAAGVRVIDIIGSPGCGKTTLIEKTIPLLADEFRIAVVLADVSTSRDADRISRLGVPAVQIITEGFGGMCHLDANTVGEVLGRLDLEQTDLLFIENVGNLVCPAEFDLGQNARVVVLSVAEGEEKPAKYPLAFRVADYAVISKCDLLDHLEYDISALRECLHQVNSDLPCVELSVRTGRGISRWLEWIRGTGAVRGAVS